MVTERREEEDRGGKGRREEIRELRESWRADEVEERRRGHRSR
jgi:hypothetical protein